MIHIYVRPRSILGTRFALRLARNDNAPIHAAASARKDKHSVASRIIDRPNKDGEAIVIDANTDIAVREPIESHHDVPIEVNIIFAHQ